MSVVRFIEDNPFFFETQAPQKVAWDRVFEQAIEHTRHVEASVLTAAARPNEPPEIKDYRNDNTRNLTKADVEKYRTKTSRIYKSSGLRVNEGSLSDVLKEHLLTMPYEYLGTPTDLMTFVTSEVYARSIDDPNAVSIEFPFNPDNPFIPPIFHIDDGGLSEGQRVSIDTKIVSHDDIVYFDSNVFAWIGGQMTFIVGEKREVAPFYWLVDNTFFYQYVPVGKKEGKIQYLLLEWYPHNTGIEDSKVLPVNLLPGVLAFAEDNSYSYQNSILHGYFEYADEFKTRFSDGQGVWINFSSPVKVVQATKCTNPQCHKGKINVFDPQTSQITGTKKCYDCDGEGINYTASPYGYYVKKEIRGDDTPVDSKPYEIVGAQSDAVQTSYDIPFDLIQKGRQAIGLDVLLGTNESGKAKDKRLEDTKDKLADNAEKLKTWIEKHLFFKECLLVVERNLRKVPSVNVPVDFDLKSSEDYRKDAEEALPNDRIEKELDYYRSAYKNNASLLKVYEVALENYPILTLEWNEVKDREALAIFNGDDIVRGDNVIAILRKFSEDNNWLDQEDKDIVQRVDDVLVEMKLILPPLDDEIKAKSKLLETVGGVKGIIEISTAISQGQMTSAAGIAILQAVFGFSEDEANKIASVPVIEMNPLV